MHRCLAGVQQKRFGAKAILICLIAMSLVACSEMAKQSIADGTGPQPVLPAPKKILIPTINIAPAKGWPPGLIPIPASGTQVAAFASDLDHPRWLYVVAQWRCFSRPVGVAMDKSGALLAADDVGNIIWRVSSIQSAKVSRNGSRQFPFHISGLATP